jgi:HEAT repeat protein
MEKRLGVCAGSLLGIAVSLCAQDKKEAVPAGPVDVPQQIEALKSRYLDDRQAGVEALKKAGAEVKSSVPQLVALFEIRNWQTQLSAAEALKNLGPNAADAAPGLTEVLRRAAQNFDIGLFTLVLETLDKIGPAAKQAAAPALLDAMKGKDAGIFQAAVDQLIKLGGDSKAKAIPAVIEALKSDSATVVSKAIGLVEVAGPDAREAGPVLADLMKKALGGKKTDSLQAIATALAKTGADSKADAARDLVKAMEGADADALSTTFQALTKLGDAEKRMGVPALVQVIARGENADLMRTAMQLLAGAGPDARDAAPALLDVVRKGIEKKDASLCQPAVDALVKVKPEDKPVAAQELVKALTKDGDPKVVEPAGDVLMRMGAEEKKLGVRPMIELLQSGNPKYAARAAGWLGGMGADAKDAIPALREAASDKDPGLSKAATEALKKVDVEPPPAQPGADKK